MSDHEESTDAREELLRKQKTEKKDLQGEILHNYVINQSIN